MGYIVLAATSTVAFATRHRAAVLGAIVPKRRVFADHHSPAINSTCAPRGPPRWATVLMRHASRTMVRNNVLPVWCDIRTSKNFSLVVFKGNMSYHASGFGVRLDRTPRRGQTVHIFTLFCLLTLEILAQSQWFQIRHQMLAP